MTDENAAKAEALILAELPGKNYGQVKRLAEQAAITVDPESAARRRERAEREQSRVTLFREETGAAALSGRDLPTDQALAAHARVCARAQEYKTSSVFPGTRMDQFRAAAYLDILNGITAEARIASAALPGTGSATDAGSDDGGTDNGEDGGSGPDAGCPGTDGSSAGGSDEPGDDSPGGASDAGGPDGGGNPSAGSPGTSRRPGDPGPSGSPGRPSGTPRPLTSPPPPGSGPPRLSDLVFPLATLLGLAERPGAGHGLGPLDPGLCRALAESAAASPFSRLCVTVTDSDGIAIGHGCAKPARKRGTGYSGYSGYSGYYSARAIRSASPIRSPDVTRGGALAALPARVNLTIPAALLAELVIHNSGAGPPGACSLVADARDPGPPGGFGAWILTLPVGGELMVRLEPVPTFACDHRHESRAYQPNDTLRHLVQIRDGECTFPPCSRHARESDFEHGIPYHQGGITCACNAGARSRQCHQVKQSKGWSVTQPRPGWHRWETPAGRSYTQGPKRYPD